MAEAAEPHMSRFKENAKILYRNFMQLARG
jgi:hypothetical protein